MISFVPLYILINIFKLIVSLIWCLVGQQVQHWHQPNTKYSYLLYWQFIYSFLNQKNNIMKSYAAFCCNVTGTKHLSCCYVWPKCTNSDGFFVCSVLLYITPLLSKWNVLKKNEWQKIGYFMWLQTVEKFTGWKTSARLSESKTRDANFSVVCLFLTLLNPMADRISRL